MPDPLRHLDHLSVTGHVRAVGLTRRGRGTTPIRPVRQRTDGQTLLGEVEAAFSKHDHESADSGITLDELRASGTFVTIEGGDAAYPLVLERLERWSGHRRSPRLPCWLLMSSTPATEDTPEQAVVWVSDKYRAEFLKLFEDYLTKMRKRGKSDKWETLGGNPANRALVANIATIRTALLRDLWQSDGEPETRDVAWWELWLADTVAPDDALAGLDVLGIYAAERVTVLSDRVVVWVQARWDELQVLLLTSLPLAEIRHPSFIDTIEDLPWTEQTEWVDDLVARATPAPLDAPAVCHLDTGVARTHVLLAGSLAQNDLMTVVGTTGFDVDGHGTKMAGISLYGNLDDTLLATGPIQLRHRLESVRILPSPRRNELPHDPLDYGTVTSEAVATAEINNPRQRVFCMPIASDPDRAGDPSLWSATVDAICVGTDIIRNGSQLRLLSAPDPEAARVVVLAAGNTDRVNQPVSASAHDLSDDSGILDPGQAWNALTVGAYTDLDQLPTDPQFQGWRPLVQAGDLSPHSRTSVVFAQRKWPIKPDICLEGGNVLTDGVSLDESHPLLSVRTTGIGNDHTVSSANATSAATAAAARLGALAMVEYPDYWPETIRGLLVHAADWTPLMADHVKDRKLRLSERLLWLRRYGWGVPDEDAVLHSSRQAVTMVTQDTFTPFEGPDFKMRHFRLHALPWPTQILQAIGAADVQLRVTLSYYIEPNPSRRGWRRRYAYASHGLRFELQAPFETERDFIARVNREAQVEENGQPSMPRPAAGNERWLVGPSQRNTGSLHQDVWDGNGADLAACDHVAVFPVGGWWKNNHRKDRADLPVRYTLLVSLRTREQGVDLYTPIATQLAVPVPVDIPAA